jgi:hypothetical protein
MIRFRKAVGLSTGHPSGRFLQDRCIVLVRVELSNAGDDQISSEPIHVVGHLQSLRATLPMEDFRHLVVDDFNLARIDSGSSGHGVDYSRPR